MTKTYCENCQSTFLTSPMSEHHCQPTQPTLKEKPSQDDLRTISNLHSHLKPNPVDPMDPMDRHGSDQPNFKQSWMVYNKEKVEEKLDDAIDVLMKYFKSCYDGKWEVVKDKRMNNYCISRLLNINNLLLSLVLHDDMDQDDYNYWKDEVYEMLEKEFTTVAIADIDMEERTGKLQEFLDATLDLPCFFEDDYESAKEEDEKEPKKGKNPFIDDEALSVSDDDSDSDDTKFEFPEFQSSDLKNISDKASIIGINDESKKRKLNQF